MGHVPLEGHFQRVNAPVASRELPMLVVGAIVAIALLVIVAAASIAGSHPSASAGCERVTVAMTTGGATIEHCKP